MTLTLHKLSLDFSKTKSLKINVNIQYNACQWSNLTFLATGRQKHVLVCFTTGFHCYDQKAQSHMQNYISIFVHLFCTYAFIKQMADIDSFCTCMQFFGRQRSATNKNHISKIFNCPVYWMCVCGGGAPWALGALAPPPSHIVKKDLTFSLESLQ